MIAPVYNELGNLPKLVQEVGSALIGLNSPFEFIAVDDGSTDGSDRLLKDLCARFSFLRVIFFKKNRGQSAAFDAGIQHASGEIVITLDADLQSDPKDIPRLLKKLDEGYDVVSGWRKNRQDVLLGRKLPSWIANQMVRKLTGTKIHDLGCSLKVYRASIIKELRLYGEMHRYICPLLENLGAKVGEVEVNHRSRTAGQSKYGMKRVFKVPLDMVYLWFNQSYQTKPMYLFGGMGIGAMILSAGLTLFAAWEKVMAGTYVHKNPVFLIAIACALAAFHFFAIGLLTELLVRTYFESQGTQPYLIREQIGFERNPLEVSLSSSEA